MNPNVSLHAEPRGLAALNEELVRTYNVVVLVNAAMDAQVCGFEPVSVTAALCCGSSVVILWKHLVQDHTNVHSVLTHKQAFFIAYAWKTNQCHDAEAYEAMIMCAYAFSVAGIRGGKYPFTRAGAIILHVPHMCMPL